MRWIDRLERRCAWMAFPGFLRFYAIMNVLVFVLQILRPGLGGMLEFDRAAILSGQVWRLVTFLFAFSGSGGINSWEIIFFIFMVLIAFMMNDALEGAWGVFRTTLYHYVGVLGLLVGNFLMPAGFIGSGYYIYLAAFFAFATLFPRVEFLIMFIIPVQIRWLALILAAMLGIGVLGQVLNGYLMTPVFYALAFANYFFWAGLPALKGQAMAAKSAQRRRKFETAKQPKNEAFHECVVCGHTDQSHPQLEFRISADGKEYCLDHLPEGEE